MDKLKFSNSFLYKTGERIIPGSVSELVLSEHYTRYIFVQDLCKDKKVLNVACGAGYGSEVLLKNASEVFNIDISEQLVAYGNLRYGSFNNHFLNMDAQKMTFPDKYFDVIVSFETFEHLPRYKDFLNECYRVLKPGGIAVISMPNKNITSPGLQKPLNQFHFKEWTLPEFTKAISKKFKINKLYGQNFTFPIKHNKIATNVIFRNLVSYFYSKMPAFILKTIKIYFLQFKDIPMQDIRLSSTHKIKNAKPTDVILNKNGQAYSIVLAILKKFGRLKGKKILILSHFP